MKKNKCEHAPLTGEDLKIGKTYRAKRPRKTFGGDYDDRRLVYVGESTVQYDSVTAALGRRYPAVTKERFLNWACHEVPDDSN